MGRPVPEKPGKLHFHAPKGAIVLSKVLIVLFINAYISMNYNEDISTNTNGNDNNNDLSRHTRKAEILMLYICTHRSELSFIMWSDLKGETIEKFDGMNIYLP